MKKEFVTYEIALKLKELGFDEECIGCFCIDCGEESFIFSYKFRKNSKLKSHITAPLWQQVIDWFRETHQIYITIDFAVRVDESTLEIIEIVGWNSKIEYCKVGSDLEYTLLCTNGNVSYQEAREQGILKALELLKT
jgi:hypothetical protein